MGKVAQFPRARSAADAEKPSAVPPSMVPLLHTPTGKVSNHYVVDAVEILRAANSEYELVPGADYPARMSPPTTPDPEAA